MTTHVDINNANDSKQTFIESLRAFVFDPSRRSSYLVVGGGGC